MQRILSSESLARAMRAGDSQRFGIKLGTDRENLVETALKVSALAPNYTKGLPVMIKGRKCVSLKDYSQNLILRAIARYVSWRFRLRVRSRDDIIREVIETLGDSTPMYIVRRDIQSFYESIDIDSVRHQLLHSALLPIQPRLFIKAYFDQLCATGEGLPRGVGLSAVIAELAMKDVDRKIGEIPGVYKYFRYSDDILIFSYRPLSLITSQLNSALPAGMAFNAGKTGNVEVCATSKKIAKQCSFEYLGYHFSFEDHCGSNKAREVRVSISARKLSRIKTKVICSLKSFVANPDMGLLRDRLRFLSGNFYAFRRGARFIRSSRYARAGIYFNYHLCGTYCGSEYAPYDGRELMALDGFFHSLLKGKSSSFAKSLSGPFIKEVSKISFFKGYEKRMMVHFGRARVTQITEAWRNA